MQSDSNEFLDYDTEALSTKNGENEVKKDTRKLLRSSKMKSKYQKEGYRKIFKVQNENRKGIRLLPNKVTPYKGCGDYLLSKKVTGELPKKFDLENIAERNISTCQNFSHRKLYQAEHDLRLLREEEKERRKSLNEKWQDLHRKEEKLGESFSNFDKFMIENKEKRERATEKISTMGELAEEKTKQIGELEKEYGQCKELKELLDSGIKNHAYIEKYLLAVVDKNHKKISTIEELFRRFDALLEARHTLSHLFERHLSQLEDAKDAVDQMVMIKCVKIAGLNNILADLHKRFETAQLTCANWEQYHQKVVLEAMNKVMEIQSVKDSIWHIYQDICKRKGLQPVFKGNDAKQLEIIKKALLKFRLVNKMATALKDENWSPSSDNASTSDSIIVNVVHKVSKKLETKSKTSGDDMQLKTSEQKVNLLKFPEELLFKLPIKHKIPADDFKKENSFISTRQVSLLKLKFENAIIHRTSESS